MLDRAAADRMLVEAYHFPFPASGHIARNGKGYELVATSGGRCSPQRHSRRRENASGHVVPATGIATIAHANRLEAPMAASSFRLYTLIVASAFALAVAMPAFAVDSPSPMADKPKAEKPAANTDTAKKKKKAAPRRRTRNPSASSSTATRPRMR